MRKSTQSWDVTPRARYGHRNAYDRELKILQSFRDYWYYLLTKYPCHTPTIVIVLNSNIVQGVLGETLIVAICFVIEFI